jgi:hypothetical protein
MVATAKLPLVGVMAMIVVAGCTLSPSKPESRKGRSLVIDAAWRSYLIDELKSQQFLTEVFELGGLISQQSQVSIDHLSCGCLEVAVETPDGRNVLTPRVPTTVDKGTPCQVIVTQRLPQVPGTQVHQFDMVIEPCPCQVESVRDTLTLRTRARIHPIHECSPTVIHELFLQESITTRRRQIDVLLRSRAKSTQATSVVSNPSFIQIVECSDCGDDLFVDGVWEKKARITIDVAPPEKGVSTLNGSLVCRALGEYVFQIPVASVYSDGVTVSPTTLTIVRNNNGPQSGRILIRSIDGQAFRIIRLSCDKNICTLLSDSDGLAKNHWITVNVRPEADIGSECEWTAILDSPYAKQCSGRIRAY